MCIQVVELYSVCKCLYYRHALDPCARYRERRHEVQERVVLVGYACTVHLTKRSSAPSSSMRPLARFSSKRPSAPSSSFGQEARSSISDDDSSEKESVFSGHASSEYSQSSIGPVDIIDEICRVLIDDPVLKNLLPLLVNSWPIKTAEKHLSRLLKRYSQDLRTEAKEVLEKQASRLVGTRAPYLSSRICGHYSYTLEAHPVTARKPFHDKKIADLEGETSGESEVEYIDDATIPHLEAVRKFLFESPAFESLEDNLENSVHAEIRVRKPIDLSFHQRLWIQIQNALISWATPRVENGVTRLQWKCVSCDI